MHRKGKKPIHTLETNGFEVRHNRYMAPDTKEKKEFNWNNLDKFFKDANTVGEILRKNDEPK